MKTLSLSVIRKNRQMKWRVIGISLLMAWASGMFIMGQYGALAMDASIEDRVENYKFPDAFVTLNGPQDRNTVQGIMDGFVTDGDVDAYQLRLVLNGHYYHDDIRYPAIIVGLEDPADTTINKLKLDDGVYFSGVDEAVVQRGMEDEGLRSGEAVSFTVLGQQLGLDITGVGISTEFLMAGDVSLGSFSLPGGVAIAFVSLDRLQALERQGAPIGDKVNSVAFIGSDTGKVIEGLDAVGVNSHILQMDHPSIIFLSANADEWRVILPVISAMFLVLGGVAILMVFSRVIQNDTRFIGVLMAMGYTHREIMRSYLSFGLSIAVISSLLGILFGYGITIGILEVFASMIGDMGIVLPFAVMPFVYGVVVCFIFVFIALLLPLYKLRMLTPSEALEHHDDGSVFVSNRRMKGSKLTVLGLRNTFRKPRQTLITMAVIGLAIGATGGWYIVGDSAITYINDLNAQDKWDVETNFASVVQAGDVNETFLGLPAGSSDSVIGFMSAGGVVQSGDSQHIAVVLASDSLTDIKDFDVEKGSLDTPGAMLAVPFADELGVGPGDSIEVLIGGTPVTLQVTAVVHSLLENMIYMPLADMPDPNQVNGAFVVLADGADKDDVRAAIYANDQITMVVFKEDSAAALAEMMETMEEFFFTFMFLNGFIAFIIAAATVTVIAAERDMEYATLKSLGKKRSEIAKPIVIEMAILTAGAVLISIPAAYVLGIFIGDLYGQTSMFFPVVFSMESAVFTVVLGVFFTMAAAIVPIRHAWHVDVERMIRERTSG